MTGPSSPAAGSAWSGGPAGAGRLTTAAARLVVVDVLSFTTAVSVAVETGIRVLPFWLPGGPAGCTERAAAEKAAAVYAQQCGARLAVARRAVTPDRPCSLSPAYLRRAPFVARLVLPSPLSTGSCLPPHHPGNGLRAAQATTGQDVVPLPRPTDPGRLAQTGSGR